MKDSVWVILIASLAGITSGMVILSVLHQYDDWYRERQEIPFTVPATPVIPGTLPTLTPTANPTATPPFVVIHPTPVSAALGCHNGLYFIGAMCDDPDPYSFER